MSVFVRGEYVSVYKGGICQYLFLRGYLSVLRPHCNNLRPWRSKWDMSVYIRGYVSICKGEYVSVYKGEYVSVDF